MNSVIKGSLAAVFVLFVLVAPMSIAFAQDMGYDYSDDSTDMGYDYGSDSADMGYDYSTPSYDMGYDYGTDGSYYDDSSTADNGTYYDDSANNGTYYDDTSDCGSTCGTYYDDTADNGTYYDDTADNGTYYDDTADSGTYYDDEPDGTPCPVTCSDYTEQNGVLYSNDETQTDETQQDETQQQEEYQEEETLQPMTVTAPQYAAFAVATPALSIPRPTYAVTPIITPTPVYHTPVPQPIVYNTPSQPSITTNTCTNGSCNTTNTYSPTTNTYTDNSINNSGNTTVSGSYNTALITPVAATPIQQVVQYTFPSQPTYPTYPVYPVNNVACTITAIPNTIAYNQPTTLSWSAPGATTAVLSDGIGSIAPNGSLIARPASSVDYVLTVWGPNGQTSSCNVWVTVSGSQVSLTQIPYTGFDFGPFGDALYWLGLLAFAGAAGYLLVYYKGGAMTLATAMVGNKKVAVATKATSEVKVAAPVVATAPVAVAVPFARPASVQSGRATIDSMHVTHRHGDMPRIVITRA